MKEHKLCKVPWRTFKCLRSEVRLDITLKCGQSFRWAALDTSEQPAWIGVFNNRVWLLRQDDSEVQFKVWPEQVEEAGSSLEVMLKDYFQLNVELSGLYEEWARQDPIFEKVSASYSGVRMLRQHPVENLFSFICSSNNNIQRISSMVEKLAEHYGSLIGHFPDPQQPSSLKAYHAFPSIQALAKAPAQVEAKLRKLGFGYRAGYIAKSAKMLQENGGEKYLFGLRDLSYSDARKELLKLTGVGPKVADCILLMSLDHPSAIPVDTHMFQIAAKKYLPHLRSAKTVTDKIYTEIGDHFRELYGPYAGWAHSVLFSADLRHLQDVQKEDAKKPQKRGMKTSDNVSTSKNKKRCK